ncbi:MAG: hypothetical protein ABJE95_31730, partial [Byssovorax sp.]
MSLRELVAGMMSRFGKSRVGGTAKPCPGATPVIHLVDDGGVPATNSATVKSTLEVSNRVTTVDLPPGFPDASIDRDNFKIEVIDSTVVGNVIAAASVELEAMTHKKASFSPKRKIQVELRRVGTTHVFRSKYIRLVVDDADHAAAGIAADQLLLTDWDRAKPTEEILAQVIRATYSSAKCGKVKWEATVGNAHRMHIRVALHILRATVGGAGVVPLVATQHRVQKWMRRNYAQLSLAPKIMLTRDIDPVENLISISDDTGTNATGASSISFTLRTGAGKHRRVYAIGPHVPLAGDTPMVTANHLAALIRAHTPLVARTVQNNYFLVPAAAPGGAATAGGAADLIITGPGGAHVTISALAATDATQTVTVAQVNPTNLRGFGGYTYWVAGSIAQRCLLQNYDTGRDRIDIVVAINLVNGAGVVDALGQAMIEGSYLPAGMRSSPKVTHSVYIARECMNATDGDCFALAHECGHVLLDAIHTPGDSTQIMWD